MRTEEKTFRFPYRSEFETLRVVENQHCAVLPERVIK